MYREIYLDNSATTKPFDNVIEYINEINKKVYGNPSSMHRMGIDAEKHIKKSREIIAGTLGVDSKEIYFTSGGTEANNMAIRGYLEANPRKGKHLITSIIEHASVLEIFKYLETKGYSVDYLNVDANGKIDMAELNEKITKDTSLISIMLVNNEVGVLQAIEEIVRLKNTRNKETVVHVDAVQAYGKIRIFPKKSGIDLMSISSHKIHGPKGVGGLYVSKNIRIKPIILGGGQESLLRSGTENVSGICGFGLASEIIHSDLEENTKKIIDLKQLFINKLTDNISGYKIISPSDSLPNILNISFSNLKSEVLLHHLEERNIFVSTGSACSSRKKIHSYVLKAMGLPAAELEGGIRFSFSSFNNEEDIIDTVNALKDIIPKIQIKRGGAK